jgi:formate-dependent nitrite reductase membrane component NrfD
MPPSDTFFTKSPDWGWLIVFYFFFGGLAAGCFVFSGLLDLFGRPGDRKLARLGYIIAFPALALCPILLTIDLTRPERFWHMMFKSNTGGIMLKTYSPMSFGAWALALFGIFVTIGFVGAIAETSTGALSRLAFLGRGAIAKLNAVLGGIFGFIVGGYTGVLLTATNRPIWADSSLLGLLFLLSGTTTAAAVMLWLGRDRADRASLRWLEGLDGWVIIAELVVIVAMVVTLGPVAKVWMNVWGALLAAMVIFGLIVPLLLHRRGASSVALSIVGGLVLRAVVILSSGVI